MSIAILCIIVQFSLAKTVCYWTSSVKCSKARVGMETLYNWKDIVV